ncbi:MAG: TonB-dependent receptor [Aureispira sp.]|nr:TonB-dependent receptor [Aureispira sp.]
MKGLSIFIFCILYTFILGAQNSTIKGRLLNSDQESVIAATVVLLDIDSNLTSFTASSDLDGAFEWQNVPVGNYILQVSCIGYQGTMQPINAKEGVNSIGKIELTSGIDLDAIEVKSEKVKFASPIRVSQNIATKTIVDLEFMQKTTSPTNLVEAVTMVGGVQEEVACGVCFTNNISINGLPGQYTAVLIDGTPMYGNLASVYGLNGMPSMVIDQIEVTKGPSSTIFGSEAVAGVINIITKKPKDEPLFSIDLMGTSHLEAFTNVAFAPKFGKLNGVIAGNHVYFNGFEDHNDDGFGDIINVDRVSLFTKWSLDRPQNRKFNIFGRFLYEDRRNGTEAYLKDRAYRQLRGDTEIYGESIFTNRWEVMGTYDLPTTEYIRVDFSGSGHYQDSYYGSDYYKATQYIGYNNWVWNKYVKGHGLTGGLTLRYQHYDDNTVATEDSLGQNRPDNQFIPGIFLQDAWDISSKVSVLYGCRVDYYKGHGVIPAPRFNLRYKPSTWTTFRLNFGTGFRVVNLFTEDHAFITGNRRIELEEKLQPERSYNGTLNFNHIFTIGNSQGMIDVDGFYTYFTNAILPDYSESNKIVYRNLDGYAQTRGFNINYMQQFAFPLSFNLVYNMQWAHQTIIEDNGSKVTSPLEYAALCSGNASLDYTYRKWGLTFAYTVKLTGPMTLPEVFDLDDATGQPLDEPRSVKSKPFQFHNFQITKEFKKINLTLYGGIQNIFNYRQPISPLAGFNDPNSTPGFSDYFDTAYAYSPIHGREFYVGLRWNINSLKKPFN